MTDGLDYGGISLLIGATAVLITAVGGQVMSIMVFIRQGIVAAEMNALKHSVNGQSETLKALAKKEALKEGEEIGRLKERANPTPTIDLT